MQYQFNPITEDLDGSLWVGTQQGGLFRHDRETDRFTRFLDDPNDPNSVINDEIRVLIVDQQGRIWAGTFMGVLHKYDCQKESFSNYL